MLWFVFHHPSLKNCFSRIQHLAWHIGELREWVSGFSLERLTNVIAGFCLDKSKLELELESGFFSYHWTWIVRTLCSSSLGYCDLPMTKLKFRRRSIHILNIHKLSQNHISMKNLQVAVAFKCSQIQNAGIALARNPFCFRILIVHKIFSVIQVLMSSNLLLYSDLPYTFRHVSKSLSVSICLSIKWR